jgi:hypothetical protein
LSQIYKTLSSGGPIPPTIPTSFTTQSGTAVPAANILIVNGFDSTENNANGIITKGGVVGTGTANEVDVVITNRLQGSGSTVGATSADVITFTPTVTGTYSIEYRLAAYNTTSLLGSGNSLFGAIRFDGVNSNICDTFDEILNEEGAMSGTDVSVVVSGASVILRATGYAAQTINWGAVGLYTFIGA